jgi:hypothetical protein
VSVTASTLWPVYKQDQNIPITPTSLNMTSHNDIASTKPRKHVGAFVGEHDSIGEGDTELVLDILPSDLADTAFEKLREEVQWHIMKHRGGEVPRLVAQQGEVGSDGR